MIYLFERLGLKQKVIIGFSLLSVILIFGMGYMLFEFTVISKISTDIIEKQRPIIRSASNAREDSQIAINSLHKYILDGKISNLKNYYKKIVHLKQDLNELLNYAKKSDFELNEIELHSAINNIDKINLYVVELEKYKSNYVDNHPIIYSAAKALNPVALEYLGIINNILFENKKSGLSREVLMHLAEMRHSWTQMLSSLRITLATQQAREFVNVKVYANLNKKQTEELMKLNLELGFEGAEKLDVLRKEYLKRFELVTEEFDSNIWSMDAHMMTTKIMPLFDKLDFYLANILSTQLEYSKNTDVLLSQQLNVARYNYIALILISLVVSFLIASFITRSVRKPLRNLVNASKEVAEGNFDTEINIVGQDEISHLAQSFNEMVCKLKESQLALTSARDNSKSESNAKSLFLTRMSHELRTPLNAILGFSQILNIDPSISDDNSKYVNNILKSGWHLLDLVEELLDLGRIETNTILIKSEKKNVFLLLQECIDIVRPMADEKMMGIYENIDIDCSCFVSVDSTRFKQVVINLLTNAVKFNRDNGKINIECKLLSDKDIEISVCDEGEGLTKTAQTEIFDAFQRLDADKKAISGVGIGLNIAKNLVELMQGSIGVKSEIGKGSCFWIKFPIVEITYESAVIDISKKHEVVKNNDKNTYKVLYVEDDEFNLELVREILSVMRPKIKLFEAETAEDGMIIIANEKLDLILMDLNLPGMSGPEALEVLQNNTSTSDIPVVAISADAMKDTIDASKVQGFKDYITKPLNIDDFLNTLDTMLK